MLNRVYSELEQIKQERANVISHGIALLASIFLSGLFIENSFLSGNKIKLISSIVFSLTTVLTYASSVLFHGAKEMKTKILLLKLDVSLVSFLISSSAFPLLFPIKNYTLISIYYALSLLTSIVTFVNLKVALKYVIFSDLIMGSLILFAAKNLYLFFSFNCLLLFSIGLLIYIMGVLFLLKENIFYSHCYWHIATFCSTILYFFTFNRYL